MKIGFIGYSDTKFNINKANEIINKIKDYISLDDEIVSGATLYGIPKLVYETLKDNKTIGIMCKDGYNYPLYPCDVIYAIGNNWGDESEFLIDYIDVLIKIGGGKQSIKELQMAKNKGIPTYEFELEPIFDKRK